MTATLEGLKMIAAGLSEKDRLELAEFLLRSDDAAEEGLAAAWKGELKRRMAEIRAGTVVGIPLEQTLSQLREEYP